MKNVTEANVAGGQAHAERLASWLHGTDPAQLPETTVAMCRRLVMDVTGLCIAARREDYVRAVRATAEKGPCTAIGHEGGYDVYSAALINGTAAHGEDYDDTFEGGPVHSGAVIVPAVLAAAERFDLSGDDVLVGIACGVELLCRMGLVAPKAIHTAGFHPTAVIGTMAAAAGVGAALGLDEPALASALGIAGSQASGIIEYLAEGTWTKRMHAGWAAQSGIRAALIAREGFLGPRTVLEGVHGFYKAFAPSVPPNFDEIFDGLGTRWVMDGIAFKPYACGTMIQPFIDCAVMLAERGVQPDQVAELVCNVGEGTVHRLWEPVAVKQRPPTAYAAKFSTQYGIAMGLLHRKAGFEQFTEEMTRDPAALAVAGKVRYVIDPSNPYPKRFVGHIRAVMKDGSEVEVRQPHMRGGKEEPMSEDELTRKFVDNAVFGGWDEDGARAFAQVLDRLFAAKHPNLLLARA
jgi:2-methylcitrate dehydratase PrpD